MIKVWIAIGVSFVVAVWASVGVLVDAYHEFKRGLRIRKEVKDGDAK